MTKNKKETILILIIATVLHLIVDLFSIYTVGNLVRNVNHKLIVIMLYNFFAFCLQMPIGLVSDKINKNFEITSIGCFFIFLSYWIKEINLCIFLVGIGNAMFHIGMGREVLIRSENKATMPGIFVSAGAIGVYLGKQLLNSELEIEVLFLIIVALIFFVTRNHSQKTKKEKVYNINKTRILVILLFAISVGIRAFVGVIKFDNSIENKLLITVIAVFLGKFLGGILSDKFGMRNITIVSLSLSIISFLFYQNNYFYILGTFLFNMTMPITVTIISNIMSDKKGFAFGITTFMLFIGSSFIYFNNMYVGYLVIPFLMIQIVLMMYGFYIYKNMI